VMMVAVPSVLVVAATGSTRSLRWDAAEVGGSGWLAGIKGGALRAGPSRSGTRRRPCCSPRLNRTPAMGRIRRRVTART